MVALVDLGPQGRTLLGQRGRQRITSEFGIESVAQRYADLYGELARGQKLGI